MRSHIRNLPAVVVTMTTLALLCGASSAAARVTSLQLEHFEPLPGQGTNVLNIGKSDLVQHLRPAFGLFFHMSDDPLAIEELSPTEGVTRTTPLVGQSVKLELSAAFGLFDWVDLGVVLPLTVHQSGGDLTSVGGTGQADGFALQDPRLLVKTRLLRPEWAAGVGGALILVLYVPGGDAKAFGSDGEVRFEPRLVFDWRHDIGVSVSANLALQLRPRRQVANVVSSHSFRWGLGVEAPLGFDGLELAGSLFGSVALETNRDPWDTDQESDDLLDKPIEGLLAVQYTVSSIDMVFSAGAGAGLTAGLGAPAWRVLASVGYTPVIDDTDLDGIEDHADLCPGLREDVDDFQDEDGCPDDDNDGDEVPDRLDRCPDVPEDMDAFEDEDGCPEADNDGDGVDDESDQCPTESEDRDGHADEDGCPDTDNDGDGVLDVDDRCPDSAEDLDRFADLDGCPDDDNDEDGISDIDDLCPNAPETLNGFVDEDGCPDKRGAKAILTKGSIKILDKVYFATGRAKIKKRSHALLREVGAILVAHPEIDLVQVEGHTDDVGADAKNMSLSQARAEAVSAFLVRYGVAPERLLARGFGETAPVDTNDSKEGRASNRRVEFRILRASGEDLPNE